MHFDMSAVLKKNIFRIEIEIHILFSFIKYYLLSCIWIDFIFILSPLIPTLFFFRRLGNTDNKSQNSRGRSSSFFFWQSNSRKIARYCYLLTRQSIWKSRSVLATILVGCQDVVIEFIFLFFLIPIVFSETQNDQIRKMGSLLLQLYFSSWLKLLFGLSNILILVESLPEKDYKYRNWLFLKWIEVNILGSARKR